MSDLWSVVPRDGKYTVESTSTGRSIGEYDSQEEAERRRDEVVKLSENSHDILYRMALLPDESLHAAMTILKRKYGTAPDVTAKSYLSTVVKADEEKRYTFAPLYMPNWVDAHGEFILPDDLQESIWSMSMQANHTLNLQHTSVLAGYWVELACWPYEHTCQLWLPDRGFQQVTLPAGTAYMGARWEPWAWELVLRGMVRGYSMEGVARRVEVDFGPLDSTYGA